MTQTLEATTAVELIGTDASQPNREVIAKASALVPLIRAPQGSLHGEDPPL